MMQLIADYLFNKNRRTSSIKFSVSYEKDTTKDSEARQLIKSWPTKNHTEPKRTKTVIWNRAMFCNQYILLTETWIYLKVTVVAFYHYLWLRYANKTSLFLCIFIDVCARVFQYGMKSDVFELLYID